MQLIGAHMSIAGGVHRAIDEALELGCTAIQIFVKQARKLFDKPLTGDEIRLWSEKMKSQNIVRSVIAHTGYLINIANPEQEKWESSVKALVEELVRCDLLKIPQLVMHPGSPHDRGEKWGIKRIAEAIDRIYESENIFACIALETVSGSGSHVGWKFEQMADIISTSRYPAKLNVAFDTCHTFSAGYDFTTEEKFYKVWDEFDRIIGREKLVAIHMNDSKYPLGSHKDRHEHIGKGQIGIEPFGFFMKDKRLEQIPKILETPKEDDWDRKNLKTLWHLSGQNPPVKL